MFITLAWTKAILAPSFLVGVLCCHAAMHAQENDPDLQERFMEGVASAGRKIGEVPIRVKCTNVTQLVSESKERTEKSAAQNRRRRKAKTVNLEVAIHGENGLETGIRATGNTYFRVVNDTYAFALEQSEAGANLQFVEKLGVDPSIDASIVATAVFPRAFAFAAYYLWTDPLYRLVESKTLSINRVYAIQSGIDQLVRVEFECSVGEGNTRIRYTEGFLVCDPNKEWALVEYGATGYAHVNERSTVLHVALKYDNPAEDFPVATSVIQMSHPQGDPGTVRKRETTTEVVGHDVQEEEFYLSYYGLPEPNFARSWFGRWQLYLIGGIGCIAIGAVIVKWRKLGR